MAIIIDPTSNPYFTGPTYGPADPIPSTGTRPLTVGGVPIPTMYSATVPSKITEFQVHKRVNGPTLRAKPPADLMRKIKADFVKQLVDKLMAADAIEITSLKSDKNDSVSFTATLRVETKS